MDCSLPGSSIHGIFQERILEWVAIPFSRRSSRSRDWTWVSSTVGRCLTIWATRKYKKDLNDPNNQDGVITHLEPNILECEVKWTLGNIITNKARGDDGIPVELFQIVKDGAVKVLHSIYQQIWKTQQWSQDCKRSVFIPIPKKGNAKECSKYCKLHSPHILAK